MASKDLTSGASCVGGLSRCSVMRVAAVAPGVALVGAAVSAGLSAAGVAGGGMVLAALSVLIASVAGGGALVLLNRGTSVAWPMAFVAAQGVRYGLAVVFGVLVFVVARPGEPAVFVLTGGGLLLGALLIEVPLAAMAAGAGAGAGVEGVAGQRVRGGPGVLTGAAEA